MRVYFNKGVRKVELTKAEETSIAKAEHLLAELARYPEDYPRAALAADTLSKLKEPLPTPEKK